MKKILIGTLALSMLNASVAPLRAQASSATAPTAHEAEVAACAPRMELNLAESQALLAFNARLSHLRNVFGTARFEATLSAIVNSSWPKVSLLQVSPILFEKARILVEQARLRHAIALTIGLESAEWKAFEYHMNAITLRSDVSQSLTNPFEKASIDLLNALGRRSREAGPRSVLRDSQNMKIFGQRLNDAQVERKQRLWELRNAEAIARASETYTTLMRWRVINGEITREGAEASARAVAVVAVGAIGIGVLYSTLVISGPVLTFAGSAASEWAAGSVISPLVVKVAEAAAGAGIGLIGAPAAYALFDSYGVLSDSAKQSANAQSNYLCELSRRMDTWAETAPSGLLDAALIGAGMGFAGGTLTFTAKSAKVVLMVTGFGVGIAQLYAVGSFGVSAVEALQYYKMAEELEELGNHEKALEALFKARDLSQAAGEHLLEGVVIGLLSYHVSHNFKAALRDGERAIRQLYAASADTLPTAGSAVVQVANSLASLGPQLSTQLMHLKALTALVSRSSTLSPTLQVVVQDRKNEIQRNLDRMNSKNTVDDYMKMSPTEMRRQTLNKQNGQ